MKTNIIYMTKKQYLKEATDILFTLQNEELKEQNYSLEDPKFGEIWICSLPVLIVDQEKIHFKKQNRPVLIIDDTHEHLIKKDTKNYYGLKITSQNDSYQRIAIKEYQKLGLKKESYIRLELPLKIEREQCLYKISKLDEKKMNSYLKEVSNFIQREV